MKGGYFEFVCDSNYCDGQVCSEALDLTIMTVLWVHLAHGVLILVSWRISFGKCWLDTSLKTSLTAVCSIWHSTGRCTYSVATLCTCRWSNNEVQCNGAPSPNIDPAAGLSLLILCHALNSRLLLKWKRLFTIMAVFLNCILYSRDREMYKVAFGLKHILHVVILSVICLSLMFLLWILCEN